LDVDETSLVDSPANESEFLVLKNTEDSEMGAEAAAKTESTETTEAERIQVEVPEGGEQVAKALEHVNAIVDNVAKMAAGNGNSEENKPDTDPAPAPEGGDEDGDAEPTDEEVQKANEAAARKAAKAAFAKAGLKGEDLDKAVNTLMEKAGFGKLPFPGAKPFGKGGKTKKTEKSATEQHAEDWNGETSLTMDGLAEAVNKAKAFTPARIAKLAEAMEILKLVIESVQPNMSPKTRPSGSTQFGASGISDLSAGAKKPVVKSEEDAITEGFKEVAKAIESIGGSVGKLNERIESIEKARAPSNSVEEDGGTDTKTAKSDGLWSGVL
jgi:hypothetical protein